MDAHRRRLSMPNAHLCDLACHVQHSIIQLSRPQQFIWRTARTVCARGFRIMSRVRVGFFFQGQVVPEPHGERVDCDRKLNY